MISERSYFRERREGQGTNADIAFSRKSVGYSGPRLYIKMSATAGRHSQPCGSISRSLLLRRYVHTVGRDYRNSGMLGDPTVICSFRFPSSRRQKEGWQERTDKEGPGTAAWKRHIPPFPPPDQSCAVSSFSGASAGNGAASHGACRCPRCAPPRQSSRPPPTPSPGQPVSAG